ncbi:type II toxin-antitoxin system HicB family antitoxin [Tomitella gaofuii]|uniref:type II toxin-antitoxin system HicB family antitoxin n=1 Tax=Tomitella gaofuii TaxID=2760083 RepID=UPI0015FC2597|nr:HicB family toxin-antitoxin system [Tomitella gaofuii]
MSHTYRVTVTREDGWWMVRVPELDAITQARRISEAHLMAQELIALHTDQNVDDVAVDVTIEIGGKRVDSDVHDAVEQRQAADDAVRAATEAYRSIARDLTRKGVPLRDVGDMLDVSYQRAHQLAGK